MLTLSAILNFYFVFDRYKDLTWFIVFGDFDAIEKNHGLKIKILIVAFGCPKICF